MRTLRARRDQHGFGALNEGQVAELRCAEAAEESRETAAETSETEKPPCNPCQACGAAVEEKYLFCTMCGEVMDVPGRLEGWLELIIEEEASEDVKKQELMGQEPEVECRFGSDEWVVKERAKKLALDLAESIPAKRIRTAAEQQGDDAFLDWEMGVEVPQEHPVHDDGLTGDRQLDEVTDTDGESCQSEPVCSTSVDEGVQFSHEVVQPQVHDGVRDEVQDSVLCTSCGHHITDMLCCQARRTYAQVVVSGRAGERQKQEIARRLKDQRRLEEEALLRHRVIPSVAQAQTAAQLSMARVRERMLARTGR